MNPGPYRGRIAPSPTGLLHLGHARTFWMAQQRARQHDGKLVFRNEDLDRSRCRPEYVRAMFEDLHWLGLVWDEGPDCGGAYGPYHQSERHKIYAEAFEKLKAGGFVYPCTCSRQDVLRSAQAPHADEEEPIYPGTCRPGRRSSAIQSANNPQRINWRFQVPEEEVVSFVDEFFGPQKFFLGRDFGDFVVWRHDHVPAYQLAVVVDDAAMGISEVVRGADLLTSTARQLLLYRALGYEPPSFYHCPLMTDESGKRLAKRHDALSLKQMREEGKSPEELRTGWGQF